MTSVFGEGAREAAGGLKPPPGPPILSAMRSIDVRVFVVSLLIVSLHAVACGQSAATGASSNGGGAGGASSSHGQARVRIQGSKF